MYARTTTILNEEGLHARPASVFIQEAKKFKSEITVIKGDKKANAKSMTKMLTLAAGKGTEIKIVAEGSDEKMAVDSLVSLIDQKFGI